MTINYSQKRIVPVNGSKGKLNHMLNVGTDKLLFYGTFYEGAYMYDLVAEKVLWEHIIKRKDSFEGLMLINPIVVENDIVCVWYDRSEKDNPKDQQFIVRLNINTGEEVWRAEVATRSEFLVHGNKVYAFGGKSLHCFDLGRQGKNTFWKKALNLKTPEVFKESTASDPKGNPSEKYLKKKTINNFKYCIWNEKLVVTTDVNKWAVIEPEKGIIIREIDLTTASVIKEVMTYPIGEIKISGNYAIFMHHGVFVRVNLAEGTVDAIIPTYKGKRKDAPDEPHTFWSYYDHGGFSYNGRFYTNNATYNKERNIQEVYELPIDTQDGKMERVFKFPLPFKGGNVKQAGSLIWVGYYGEDSQKRYPGATFYSLEDGTSTVYLPEKDNFVLNINYSNNHIMILVGKKNKQELHFIPYQIPVSEQAEITLEGAAVTVQPQKMADILTERYEYLNAKGEKVKTYENTPVDLQGKTPRQLTLHGSILLTQNNADRACYYLGGNLVSVVGGIPAFMDVVDISTGKVIWTIDQCEDKKGMVVFDEDAVYMARETFGKHFLTAHHRMTGETLWHCPLSGNHNQFSTPLVAGEKHILHSNGKSNIIVDKKTGKKISKMGDRESDSLLLGLLHFSPDSYLIQDKVVYYVQEGVLKAIDLLTNKTLFSHDFIKNLYFEATSNFELAEDKKSFTLCIVGRNLNAKNNQQMVTYILVKYNCTNHTMTCTETKAPDNPLSLQYKNELLYLCNPDGITVVKPDDMTNPFSSLPFINLEYEPYYQGCIFAGDTIISLQKGENNTYTKMRFKGQSMLHIIKEKQ